MSRVYAPKADSNHGEIRGFYEDLYCSVYDVHIVPGFVDFVVGVQTKHGRVNELVEVKTEDGKPTAKQKRFACEWRGKAPVVVRTKADVIAHVERLRSGL